MFYINEKPICKVGDTFYRIIKEEVVAVKITKVEKMTLGHYVYKDNTGRTYFKRNFEDYIFKSKKSAEEYMNRKKLISKKKELLKKYEDRLNTELGIQRHYFVK